MVAKGDLDHVARGGRRVSDSSTDRRLPVVALGSIGATA
jgi:hypothetical protein